MQQLFFVGSYTHPSMGGKGQGIYTCALESTGQMSLLETFALNNPSYLIFDKDHKYLFAVEESKQDLKPFVHSFRIDDKLIPLSKQSIPGDYACHLGLDAEGRFLAVANYGTGNIVLYAVEDGRITKQLDNVQHQGKGFHKERQEGPHAHATVFSPDNQFLLVIDLGLDEVKSYTFTTGKLELYSTFKTTPGAGPRHLVFHPSGDYVFVLNELDSTLMLLSYTKGILSPLQTVSTLPPNDLDEKWAAAIHISTDGQYIYTSNRKHDSLAVFHFDVTLGHFKSIQHISSGGQIPRDFSLDPSGKLLVVAHQESDDLFSFWIKEGQLEATGHSLQLGTPICVKML
jgi:6-phosphogluconolactonase